MLGLLPHVNRPAEDKVDPDAFIRWGFARLIDWRAPRYEAIARRWGVQISARDVEKVQTPDEFLDLVDEAVAKKPPRPEPLF